MSIAFHGLATAATTLPAVAAPAAVVEGQPSAPMVALWVAWAVAGLAGAAGLGAFGRRGILGPERLAADDSAWPLLGLLGVGLGGLILGLWLANGAVTAAVHLTHAAVPGDAVQLAIGAVGEGLAVAAVLVAVWARRPQRDGLRLIGLSPRRLPAALAGGTAALFVLFPLVALSGLAVAWALRRLHLPQPQPHVVLQMMGHDQGWSTVVAGVLTAAVIAPLAEELAFRGVLQTLLGRVFNRTADRLGLPSPAADGTGPHTRPLARWAAVVVTSLAFAAVHGEPAFLAPLFLLSVGLGFVYERSGNLWMTIVTHGLFNAAQIAAFLGLGG